MNKFPLEPFTSPLQGEVWKVNLDPTMGHEQNGIRPAVVVSVDGFNRGPSGLVVVVPMTTVYKGISWHIKVEPPEGNLRRTSYLKCEEVRSITTDRLLKGWGTLSPQSMERISDRLGALLQMQRL